MWFNVYRDPRGGQRALLTRPDNIVKAAEMGLKLLYRVRVKRYSIFHLAGWQ